GFSPRYVVNQLSRALARAEGCLTGGALLDMLAEGLTQRAGLGEDERASVDELLATARAEYDEMVRRAVRRATIAGFEDAAGAFAREVQGELRSWSVGVRSDGAFPTVRRLEDALGVPAYLRDDVRRELLAKLDAGAADARLEEASERLL